MAVPDRLPPSAGIATAAPVALAALALWRPSLDVFMTVKATVLVLGTLALLSGLLVRRISAPRLPSQGRRGHTAAVVALAAALGLATVMADHPIRSLVGAPGRHGGLTLYLTCGVLALVAARLDARGRARAVAVLVAASAPVAAYALVQAAGADPWMWTTVEGGVAAFSTLGNVDFASAWLGMAGVLAAGVAVAGEGRRRVGAAVVGLLCTAAATATGSLQGPAILLLAGALVLLRWLRTDGRRQCTRPQLVAGGAGVAAVLLLAGVVALPGALRSLESRTPKWGAALRMAEVSPFVGLGLDSYGDWWWSARTPEVAAAEGLGRSVDNAHSVPLHLLAGGGLLVLGTWGLVLVAIPASGVLRGHRRRRGTRPGPVESVDLAIVLAWLGYLLQSTVSIDVPPLAGLGFLLAGMVTGATVPDGPPRPAGTTRTGATRPARLARPALAGVAVLAVLGATATVITRPLRADLAGWRAQAARIAGDDTVATAASQQASALAPWDGRADAQQATWRAEDGDIPGSIPLRRRALAREPRSLAHALNLARALTAAGRPDEATAVYAVVAEIDPHTPAVQQEIAAHLAGTIVVGEARSPRGGETPDTPSISAGR